LKVRVFFRNGSDQHGHRHGSPLISRAIKACAYDRAWASWQR
jgi:hypothetical protein